MKYIAIIFLAIFGLIELFLRGILALATLGIVMIDDSRFMTPWCFRMAEKVLAS
jgi:hypothetical protein